MDRKTREELNKLSKEVFGTSSRWQKIMDKGVAEPHERDREVMIPGPKGLEKKVFTDKKSIVKHYSLEEVRQLMNDILEARKKIVVAETAVPTANEEPTVEYGTYEDTKQTMSILLSAILISYLYGYCSGRSDAEIKETGE